MGIGEIITILIAVLSFILGLVIGFKLGEEHLAQVVMLIMDANEKEAEKGDGNEEV